MSARLLRLVVGPLLVASLGLVACSSDDDGGGGGAGTTELDPVFASYCTGTLLVATRALPAVGPGSWGGTNVPTAAVGTTFLVGHPFNRYEGYLFLGNGQPAELQASDFQAGFVKGTDFTTDCDETHESVLVVLRSSTLYEAADRTGTPCTLPVGTTFASYGFGAGGTEGATFTSNELVAKCGFEKGYTNDLVYGSLLKK